MALDREPTLTQGNIQGTPFHLLQKGEILKRYTCESKTLRVKVQHHHKKWELCLVCQHSFNLAMLYALVTAQDCQTYMLQINFMRDTSSSLELILHDLIKQSRLDIVRRQSASKA